MQLLSRCRQACRWARQRYGCTVVRHLALSILAFTSAALFGLQPISAQSLLHIRILEGDGGVHGAGSKESRALAVQITDETGRPVENATVSFRLPEEGPGGTFPRGLKTEIVTTTPDGRAAIYGAHWNKQPGPFQVRITAVKGEIRAGTTSSQYISDAPAAQDTHSARSSRKKWITIVAIAGGAAAGVAAGTLRSSKSTTPSSAAPPQIGLPTITVGKF